MQQSIKLIQYLSSFVKLSVAFIDSLQSQLTLKKVEEGEVYVEKNAYSTKLGFINEGIMRIYDIDSSGREWNKVILSSPSLVVGNANYRKKSIHLIDAITPCELLELPMSFFGDALKQFPETQLIQSKLLLMLYEKKSEREYDFLSLTAKERYLKFLKTHQNIIDQLPQFHIASYLGITPTQLSRINSSLRNQHM